MVGSLMCCANMYFGLQTVNFKIIQIRIFWLEILKKKGWVTMGSLQSTILGFGFFKLLGKKLRLFQNFGPTENVVLQTTAVATATM